MWLFWVVCNYSCYWISINAFHFNVSNHIHCSETTCLCLHKWVTDDSAEEDWLSLVPITPAGRDFNSLLFSFQWMPTSATTRDQMRNEARFLMRVGHKRDSSVVDVNVFTDSDRHEDMWRLRLVRWVQMCWMAWQTDRGHHLSVYKHTSVHI